MALPVTGPLSFDQINVELGNVSGSQASIRAMSAAATPPKSIPDSVSEFYGYSDLTYIYYSWGTKVNLTDEPIDQDWYRPVPITTGRTSGNTYTLNFSCIFTPTSGETAPTYGGLYYQLNGTSGTWTNVSTIYSILKTSGTESFSIGYNDTVYMRMRVWGTNVDPEATFSVALNNGSVSPATNQAFNASGTPLWIESIP